MSQESLLRSPPTENKDIGLYGSRGGTMEAVAMSEKGSKSKETCSDFQKRSAGASFWLRQSDDHSDFVSSRKSLSVPEW
jgi:hypothetical protein